MGWYEQRFIPRAAAVKSSCGACGRDLWFPPSQADRRKSCGGECAAQLRDSLKRVVEIKGERVVLDRPCETCGNIFRPRPILVRKGQGRFCSQHCNTAGRAALAVCRDATNEGIRKARAEGRWTILRGEANPQWKGGKAAARERRKPKQAASTREYRKRNPDKVREFTARRAGRKLGKLPYGTLPKLRRLQGNRCAICRCSIARASHVDHIIPLARGGGHEPSNLQLLCPPCNLAKSDRDPIQHMQALGRLL